MAVVIGATSRRRAGARCTPILIAALAGAGCGVADDVEDGAGERPPLEEHLDAAGSRWWAFHGKTAAEVDALVTSNGARLVGLQVESTSPLTFAGAMVENAGTHHQAQSWWPRATGAWLEARLAETGARLTTLQPYVVDGTTYFAATTRDDAGADGAPWWWYHDASWEEVLQKLREHDARPVDLRQYHVDGVKKYAVIMVAASDGIVGTPYRDATRAEIAAHVGDGAGHLISIEPADAAGETFNVIVNRGNPGSEWWYTDGTSWDAMVTIASQNGHRLVDVKTYAVDGQQMFVGIAVDGVDPDSAKVREILRADLLQPVGTLGAAGGRYGFSVKSVAVAPGERHNVTEALLADRVKLDPASALKTLVAARVMALREQEHAGFDLTTPVLYYPFPPAVRDRSGNEVFRWCPEPDAGKGDVPTWDTVGGLLRKMLVESDNWATRALIDGFAGGFAGLNETAALAGMTSTRFAGHIGCWPFANTTTVEDLVLLYQGIEDLSLMNGDSRARLYALMPGDAQDSAGTLARARAIVEEEAARIGLSRTATETFRDALTLHYKGGSYTRWSNTLGDWAETRTIGGIARIPHCSGASSRRYHVDSYAWALYIDGARRIPSSGDTQADRVFKHAGAEPLRKAIRQRLLSWSACAF